MIPERRGRSCAANGQQSLETAPGLTKQQHSQSAVTLHRVAACCFTRYCHHSLNVPLLQIVTNAVRLNRAGLNLPLKSSEATMDGVPPSDAAWALV